MTIGKIRPQILVAIVCGTIFSGLGIYIGYWMNAIEVVTLIVGAYLGFLGGVSLKVLEED
jgi:ABC-type Mn2+/Zn2+ transport system permease subunit